MKHRRFRFGRRDARSLSPESLESVLSADIPSASNESNFEDMVLGQVDAARPFLGAAERKQVRWIRMSLIGLALGVFASGAIAVRAGLLPGTDGPGVVSSMVDSAQNKSMDQIESASTWRSEALTQLTAFNERQRSAELLRRTTPAQSTALVSSNRPSRAPYSPNASVAIGLTMQSPSCSVTEADNTSCQQVIVFNDGLAIPAGGSFKFSGATTGLVTRWPSTVQQSIEQIGLEGSGECAIGGFIPPWYGSDVIRLPEIITVRPHPDPSNPH